MRTARLTAVTVLAAASFVPAAAVFVPAAGGAEPMPLGPDPVASLPLPLPIPDAAAALGGPVSAAVAGRDGLARRAGDLGGELRRFDGRIAALEVARDRADAAAAAAETRIRRLAAAAYRYSGRELGEVILLDDPVAAARHVRLSDAGLAAQTAQLAEARAQRDHATTELASTRAERDGRAGELVAAEDELRWVDSAVVWVRALAAADPGVPALPGLDLTIEQLDAALRAARQASCLAPWTEIAAQLAPGVAAAAPAAPGGWRAPAAEAARRVCRDERGDPTRADRYVATGLPARPPDRVLVVGDSLAQGADLAGLGRALRSAGWDPELDAKVGLTTPRGLAALREHDDDRWAVIVAVLGSNDAPDAGAYRRSVELALEAFPQARFVWVTPGMTDREGMAFAVESLAQHEPRLASVRVQPEWVGGDGAHLTSSGYPALVAAITRAVGE